MRNNERVRALIEKTILASLLKKFTPLQNALKTRAQKSFVLLVWIPFTSISAHQNFSNVDQALPTLIRGGEVMQESQQWYRAHTENDSYTSNFSADGRLLALTSQNNPVELWDTIKRKTISTFTGSGLSHSEAFVDISPDGKFIAINVGDRIEVRNIDTKLLEFSVPAISGAAAAFSPDSHWFASAIDGKRIDLWDIKAQKRESSLIHHTKSISALGFSPEGKYLVSADVSGVFSVWDTESKEMLYQFSEHKKPITTVQFSATENTFVTIDTAGVVKLWDAGEKTLLHAYKTPEISDISDINKSSAAFSPDGETVIISLNKVDGKSYILLFSTLIGGKPLFTYESHDNEIDSIAFRPDGRSLVVSLSSKTIRIFDIPSRQYVDAFGGQILKANKTRVSPDGKLIATGTVDGYIQLWDAQKKTLKYSLKGRNRSIEHISFSPDGRYIISGDNRGAVTVWERNTNNRVFYINAHKLGFALGVMSPDNKYLATASSESSIIKLWDVQTNKPMFKFIGHHGDITGLAYSPDGQFIASSSKDGTIKLWNISNKSLEQSFIGSGRTVSFLSVVFSPDGRYLAGGTHQGAADKHVIEIWDAKELKHLRTLNQHESPVTAVRFSADGKQLVTGSAKGVIKVWNITSGRTTHSFIDNDKAIHSVDFTKKGNSILSVTHDGVTDLWNLKRNKKAYSLLGGPRGTWISENHIKQRFIRGDDGSLHVKTSSNDTPPAPLAPKGLATKDKLILTASRKPVKVSRKGGTFSITIKNIGDKPSFWLRASQLDSGQSSVTLLSNKLTRLDAGRRGVLNLQLIPHDFPQLDGNKKLNLKMEVTTKAGSHFPIVIPLEFHFPAENIKAGRNIQ
ncbi:MAG: WD40 repeat domain-containing protein [Thiotrichaceae bacterium]